jgi:intracellular multiplication protein IcmT
MRFDLLYLFYWKMILLTSVWQKLTHHLCFTVRGCYDGKVVLYQRKAIKWKSVRNERFGGDVMTGHWRDTARPARFFVIDYRAAFPLLLFLLHIRLWTFIVATLAIFCFYMLERFGYTVPVFLRLFRGWLAGPRKMARPWWRR